MGLRQASSDSGNITTPSPGRSSVTTKGSADIAPTSQPSRSGVLRPSTAMRWCGPIANAQIKPVIIGVYRRVSGCQLATRIAFDWLPCTPGDSLCTREGELSFDRDGVFECLTTALGRRV